MLGALMGVLRLAAKVATPAMLKSEPISVGSDDDVSMVQPPRGLLDKVFDAVNRLIRPGLVGLIIYMFFWFAFNPDEATKWIGVVKQIPNPMWDLFMVVMASIGISKAVRDWRAPGGSHMIVRSPDAPTPDEIGPDGKPVGSAKPPEPPANDPPVEASNPTLDAWRRSRGQT